MSTTPDDVWSPTTVRIVLFLAGLGLGVLALLVFNQGWPAWLLGSAAVLFGSAAFIPQPPAPKP